MELYEQLEYELATWLIDLGIEWPQFNKDNVVVCSSGTAALHLAMAAMDLPLGSEVLIPDYTMIACARAVTLAGLTPVFVDCDERLCMDPNLTYALEPAAQMIVHIYGRTCGINHLGCPVIEDLAEAHGVTPHPRTDAACWSFYKNKIIAGEEGGAVAFRDVVHAEAARELRSLGFTKAHDFRHRPGGHNYRMANCLAEKVLKGLDNYVNPKWDGARERVRRRLEGWYDEACPAEWKMPPRDAPWVYDIQIPGLIRTRMVDVVRSLNEKGVQARMGFCPMSYQEEYRGYRMVSDQEGIHCAGKAFHEVLYLPLTPGTVTRDQVRLALDVIQGLV